MQTRLPSRLFALLVATASSVSWHAAARAADPSFAAPPPWPVVNESPVTLATDPVRPLLLGALRVTLDGSTLADTRSAIGAGSVQRQGKGTDALDWLCYTVSDTHPPQRLWLTSSELSRGRIDAVVAVDLAAGMAPTLPCPELPARFRPVRFDDGLWLGGMSADLRKALGVPARSGPLFSSLFQGQTGNLTMVSSTVIEFRAGQAITLHVAHSSQN